MQFLFLMRSPRVAPIAKMVVEPCPLPAKMTRIQTPSQRLWAVGNDRATAHLVTIAMRQRSHDQ